ncbi:MAG: hypothetical protein IJV97_03890, partial [Alphaproteobacteria bacterium]|nr:hypothetical protein [Alphaproteobacteria bacterium]
ALSSGTVSCSYTEIGDYTVKLSGDFTYFGGVSGKGIVKNIIKLDKSGITKMTNVCGSKTIGVVPPLPSTLVDATSMFEGCTKINSPYPKLPATLEVANQMFRQLTTFTGSVALPTSLKSANEMFMGNTGLLSVTGLENTQLESANAMFQGCSNLAISVPTTLPSELTSAYRLFYQCPLITGKAPPKPTNFKSTCAEAYKPCYQTFTGSKVTNDGSWPTGAFQ